MKVKVKLKPIDQLIEEFGVFSLQEGHFAVSFYLDEHKTKKSTIPKGMFKYFGKEIELEKTDRFESYTHCLKNNYESWYFSENWFETEDFIKEEDFKL